MIAPDENYPRHASRALNLISTFFTTCIRSWA